MQTLFFAELLSPIRGTVHPPMSIEAYEKITARFELYTSLERGLKDIQEGNTRPLSEALSDLRGRRKK